jgi:6-phosphogluconolactonase
MLEEHHLTTDVDLAQTLAQHIAQRLSEAIEQRGQALLCVSGGKSPIPLFHALSCQALAWQHVTVTLVDERCVPLGHPDSNATLVQQHLLQGPAAQARFLRWVPDAVTEAPPALPWQEQLPVLTTWAQAVEEALRPLWPADVVVLGMGLDGHTASLFHDARGLKVAIDAGNQALCAPIRPPQAPHDRLTLTLNALRSARHLALQLQGPDKREVYEEARRTPSLLHPVSLVMAAAADTLSVWIAD